jgi:predicted aconitase
MELTKQQKEMLEGKQGRGARKAIGILLAYGQCYNVKRMVPITSVHMPGNFPVLLDESQTHLWFMSWRKIPANPSKAAIL